MLRIRRKEIENSRKQIDANNKIIEKMRNKIDSLGGFEEKGESNWELKY